MVVMLGWFCGFGVRWLGRVIGDGRVFDGRFVRVWPEFGFGAELHGFAGQSQPGPGQRGRLRERLERQPDFAAAGRVCGGAGPRSWGDADLQQPDLDC